VESPSGKPNLFGLDRPALAQVMAERGEPAYRAGQIYLWLYRRRARAIADMTDLAKGVREALAARFELRWPEVIERNLFPWMEVGSSRAATRGPIRAAG